MGSVNAIQKLRAALRSTMPGIEVEIDRPASPRGTWWMDVRWRDRAVTVEWRPDHGFGVSAGPVESYGEGSDEILTSSEDVKRRVVALLEGSNRTRARRDLLLQQIREERAVSQEQLAALLNVSQASISKLERRGDMHLSTLRRVIAALGGELEVRARFPDDVVEIRQTTAGEKTSGDKDRGRNKGPGGASVARDAAANTARRQGARRRRQSTR